MRKTSNYWKIREMGVKMSFLMPGIIILVLLSVYPFFYCIFLSFHSWNLVRPQWGFNFVGIQNFIDALSAPRFIDSVGSTFIILGGALILQFILGLGIAMLLNVDIKGMPIVRAVIILPSVVTPIVVGILWSLLYKYQYGLINYLLNFFGLPSVHWLTSEWEARLCIMLADTWQWTPFVALVILAGLRSVPEALSEAAFIDGAGQWQQFRYITLPLIKPTILVVMLLRTIDGFRMFEKIFAITKGGPAGATETTSFLIYIQGFQLWEMGVAAASSILFLVIVTIVTQIILRGFRGNEIFFEEKYK